MSKIMKRVIIIIVAAALVISGTAVGYSFLKKGAAKKAFVYPVSDFSTDYWGDTAESYGPVSLDNLQSIYLSDTQQVKEIFVTEGQEVKAGDKLLSYDTTLSDIELKRAELQIQQLQLQYEQAKKDLAVIKSYKPYTPPAPEPEPEPEPIVPVATPYLFSGTGTAADPFVYIWGQYDVYSQNFLLELVKRAGGAVQPEEPAEPGEGDGEQTEGQEPENGGGSQVSGEAYALFVVRESDALNGDILDSWGMCVNSDGTEATFVMCDLPIPDSLMGGSDTDPEPQPEPEHTYTAAELAQMRSEKEKEISELDLKIRIAQVDYERMTKEVSDGIILAEIDGVVKSLLDPEESVLNAQPLMIVSGGGGYYVQGSVSELALDTVTVGQTVTVQSWESYSTYEGTVVSVSDYPTENNGYWGSGNTNVSYYSFTVFVDESASLRENEYVSVTYSASPQGSSGLYLENFFVRSENGKNYVYVRTGEGLLEKRFISTGKTLWGSYVEILSGLTYEDYVAFPYGVTAGAETKEGTWEDLYNY